MRWGKQIRLVAMMACVFALGWFVGRGRVNVAGSLPLPEGPDPDLIRVEGFTLKQTTIPEAFKELCKRAGVPAGEEDFLPRTGTEQPNEAPVDIDFANARLSDAFETLRVADQGFRTVVWSERLSRFVLSDTPGAHAVTRFYDIRPLIAAYYESAQRQRVELTRDECVEGVMQLEQALVERDPAQFYASDLDATSEIGGLLVVRRTIDGHRRLARLFNALRMQLESDDRSIKIAQPTR